MPLKNHQFDLAMTKNVKSFLIVEGPGIVFVLHVFMPRVYH